MTHLLSLQHEDGRWEGEMVWNTMLLSQYVLTHVMLGRQLSTSDQNAACRHYEVTRLGDGTWPAHPDGAGSVYVTTLAYTALRVLGVPPDDQLVAPARDWLAAQRGGLPTWGRMWLALLGLYEYEGVTPIPPELVLLPKFLPLHPDQLYCHTRYVYLGLAYLYGRRARFPLDPSLHQALRAELHTVTTFTGAAEGADVVARPHPVLRVIHRVLRDYERHPLWTVRTRALRRCAERMRRELVASRGHGLSPVNALLGCLVLAQEGAPDDVLAAMLRDLDAWRWQDDTEGLRIVGARSSAWDTAFALRALLAGPATPKTNEAIGRGYRWLCDAQQDTGLDEPGRDDVLGGWCFSDGTHRWPVSDCTAEALSAILLVHERPELGEAIGHRLPEERIVQAVEFILARQNDDGGFGTYERRRAPAGVELLNPSEMYLDCMTDRSHVECTASCVAALARLPHPRADVTRAIERGVAFLRSRQRPDGSYPAAWGIHFTYAAFFVVEALVTAGVATADPAIADALNWLVLHQKPDGGWGEHHSSCLTGTYVEHPESQAAMTAWALLALRRGNGPREAVARAAKFLQSDGQRPRQAASGVFFGSAVLDYRLYKDIFPAWALALLDHKVSF